MTTTDDDYADRHVLASDPLLRWDAIAAHARDHHGVTWPTERHHQLPAAARPAPLGTSLDRRPGTQLHHRRHRRQRSRLRPPGNLRRDQHRHPPARPGRLTPDAGRPRWHAGQCGRPAWPGKAPRVLAAITQFCDERTFGPDRAKLLAAAYPAEAAARARQRDTKTARLRQRIAASLDTLIADR